MQEPAVCPASPETPEDCLAFWALELLLLLLLLFLLLGLYWQLVHGHPARRWRLPNQLSLFCWSASGRARTRNSSCIKTHPV